VLQQLAANSVVLRSPQQRFANNMLGVPKCIESPTPDILHRTATQENHWWRRRCVSFLCSLDFPEVILLRRVNASPESALYKQYFRLLEVLRVTMFACHVAQSRSAALPCKDITRQKTKQLHLAFKHYLVVSMFKGYYCAYPRMELPSVSSQTTLEKNGELVSDQQ